MKIISYGKITAIFTKLNQLMMINMMLMKIRYLYFFLNLSSFIDWFKIQILKTKTTIHAFNAS